jgi:N-acetylglucosaminyldiphosphoundecaprenol N-acetyl-beta-D-mannosaminyltransferase
MTTRIEMFGCPMDIATMDQAVARIADRIERRQFTQQSSVNVAKLVHMQTDAQLARSVSSCDMINVDGMGVVWAGRMLGYDIPERVAGVDLFDRLMQEAARRGLPVFLLGATQDVVSATASRCLLRYPSLKLAGHHHGYFWDNEAAMVEQIRTSGARLLFVAITSPRKENFIHRWQSELGVDFVMGVGGTFDVVAGKVKRAPVWMRRSGLEWLFRVLQEPRRMWKRYLITNARFAVMLASAWLNPRTGRQL